MLVSQLHLIRDGLAQLLQVRPSGLRWLVVNYRLSHAYDMWSHMTDGWKLISRTGGRLFEVFQPDRWSYIWRGRTNLLQNKTRVTDGHLASLIVDSAYFGEMVSRRCIVACFFIYLEEGRRSRISLI